MEQFQEEAMLQPSFTGEKVVTLVPSMFRTRSSVLSQDGERGRVLLFTGVRYERMQGDDLSADALKSDHPSTDASDPS